MRRWTRSIAVVVLVGAVTALGLFGVTSGTTAHGYLGFCGPTVDPGFDPWTGEPHGGIFRCTRIDGPTTIEPGEVPDELIGRQAVPLPFGFALGVVIALAWLAVGSIADRRRAWTPRPRAGSGAGEL